MNSDISDIYCHYNLQYLSMFFLVLVFGENLQVLFTLVFFLGEEKSHSGNAHISVLTVDGVFYLSLVKPTSKLSEKSFYSYSSSITHHNWNYLKSLFYLTSFIP